MDKFYEQFRKNLDNRPEPAFEEKDWQAMEKLLDVESPNTRTIPTWWIWLPFLLLTLLGHLFLYQKLSHKDAIIEELLEKRDTIIQTKIVYQKDTIYRERIVVRENYKPNVAPENLLKADVLPSIFNETALSLSQDWGGLFRTDLYKVSVLEGFTEVSPSSYPVANGIYENTSARLILLQKNYSNSTKNTSIAVADKAVSSLPMDWKSLDYKRTASIHSTVRYQNIDHRKTFHELMYPMMPKGLHIGVSGGALTLLNEKSKDDAGGMIGVNIKVPFSDQLRLTGDFSIYNMKFESKVVGADTGLPVVEPPFDNFDFKEAKVARHITKQWSIGAQYVLPWRQKWRPVFGLAYTSYQVQPFGVVYEFENVMSQLETEVFSEVEQPGLWRQRILAEIGVEYPLGQHWYWQTIAQYRFSLAEQSSILDPHMGLRTGLWFLF